MTVCHKLVFVCCGSSGADKCFSVQARKQLPVSLRWPTHPLLLTLNLLAHFNQIKQVVLKSAAGKNKRFAVDIFGCTKQRLKYVRNVYTESHTVPQGKVGLIQSSKYRCLDFLKYPAWFSVIVLQGLGSPACAASDACGDLSHSRQSEMLMDYKLWKTKLSLLGISAYFNNRCGVIRVQTVPK